MFTRALALAAAASVCMSQTAFAADYVVQPVPIGQETMRYDRGVATLDLQGRDGAVQVTPLGLDQGGLAFAVAVINTGNVPANFSRDNVVASTDTGSVHILSPQELAGKAKKRAFWRTLAVAAVGGLAAGIAASQNTTYTARSHTRAGRFNATTITRVTGPSLYGQIQAADITRMSVGGMVAIQAQLDATRRDIGDSAIELTTVDPGQSYGGRVVLDKIKPGALPRQVTVTVAWNGQSYPFAFRLASPGTPQPRFPTTGTVAATAPAAPVLQPAVLVPTPAPEPARPVLIAAEVEPTLVAPPAPVTAATVRPVALAPVVPAPALVTAAPAVLTPMPAAVRPVVVSPVTAPRPVVIATVAAAPVGRVSAAPTAAERYQNRLAAARPVQRREPTLGWTISD